MVTLNPFTYGNPISDPKRFVGRQREIEQVFMRLRNPEFESSSIVGERRSGKTSLLNYIAHPDVIRRYGLNPEAYLFVYLDLEMITSTSTPTRLYQYMLRRVASKTQDEALKKEIREVSQHDNIDTYDLAEVLDSMEDAGLHIVLLIDEFENVGDNANFGPDFYYGLRSLAIHHDLALITSTRVDLVEIAHSDAVRSSPFFNIFATINLQPFSTEDVQEMLRSYLEDTGISFNDAVVKYALTLAGRLPFFIQMALHFLFEAYQRGENESRRLTYVEERLQEAASPHLENYWQHSSDHEKTVLSLLTLQENRQRERTNYASPLFYWQPAELERWYVHAGLALNKLANRGLVIRQDDRYALASTTILRWLTGELTSAASDLDNHEEQQRLEGLITTALPQGVATPAVQWLRRTNTKYRGLFARWISDARTSEGVLELLTSSKMPFYELKGETPSAEGAATDDQMLEALSTVTESERRRARQLASIEGTVSVMFTDLEGSTELLTSIGDEENQELLRVHNSIIRREVANHGGLEVKALGDGFMMVFSSARRAAACAMDIQRGLREFNRKHADRQLKVRIGINVGETIQEDEDFFGSAVVLAARITARASGGQILVSDLFRKLAGNTSSFGYVDRGWEHLKGFAEEEHLYEVDWHAGSG